MNIMRMKTALLVLFACIVALWLEIPVTAQRPQQPDRLVQYPARGTRGAVAAGTNYATEAGMRMFYAGGNAVDAGVATIFAAATTEYERVGWGGEAPILIRTKDGKVHSIAGVGTMPKLATADFFRKRPLQLGEILEAPEPNGLKGIIPVAGIMCALVPGMPDANLVALRDYGTKSFNEVIAPSIEYADAQAIDEIRSGSIDGSREFFTLWPSSMQHFVPNGVVARPGEIFRQPDLARTLRAMAAAEKKALAAGATREAAIDAVRDYFYRGEIAKKIDAFSRANNGLLRYDDFAAFHLAPEDPVSTEFHGLRVYKPGFWSQGPAMIETLNMLSGIDFTGMRFNSADYINTLVEALKLAYADRDTYYGDPKFVKIPAEHAAFHGLRQQAPRADRQERLARIPARAGSATSAGASFAIRDRAHEDRRHTDGARHHLRGHHRQGRHDVLGDAFGRVAAVGGGGRYRHSADRAGAEFSAGAGKSERTGGRQAASRDAEPDAGDAGRRRPYAVLSTPGGDNQEQSLIQIFFDALLFRMNAEQAIEAPRFQTRHLVSSFDNHAMNPGDLLLDERIPPASMEDLATSGHKMETRSRWNSGAAPVLIRVTPAGVIEAGADPWGYRSMRA